MFPVLPHCRCQAMYALLRILEPSNAIGKKFGVDIAGIMDNSLYFVRLSNKLGQSFEN
jgi:hypothetical protein